MLDWALLNSGLTLHPDNNPGQTWQMETTQESPRPTVTWTVTLLVCSRRGQEKKTKH